MGTIFKLAILGEVMVELAPHLEAGVDKLLYAQSCAGDTYNTAVYASRNGLDVSYVTLLGDDPHSAQMLAVMGEEGIKTSAIERLARRTPGLYMIKNTPDGERYFTYWRGESPARELFLEERSRVRMENYLRQMDCLYLSGITLAIMAPVAREHLLNFVSKFRGSGGRLAFDSNYRPHLWRSTVEARETIHGFLQQTDIALLTFEDEKMLWSDRDEEACLQRNRRYPVAELVLKRGAAPVMLQCDGELRTVHVPPVVDVVDTTGAGDSFNAGYLAARFQNLKPVQAVAAGNHCAGQVVRHRGAIIPSVNYAALDVVGSILKES